MIRITQSKAASHFVGGYTVVELMVSMFLFTVAILLATSAFLGVLSSNRKTLAMRTAFDNLNFAVESMTRDMKTGYNYHCGGGNFAEPQDCLTPAGAGVMALEGQTGAAGVGDQIVYRLGPVGSCVAGQICVSNDGGGTFLPITAPPPALAITSLAFRVYGSLPGGVGDTDQPRVVISIRGVASSGNAKSTFDIQTMISQRLPDT